MVKYPKIIKLYEKHDIQKNVVFWKQNQPFLGTLPFLMTL